MLHPGLPENWLGAPHARDGDLGLLHLTSLEKDHILEVIQPDFPQLMAGYDRHKYPEDGYLAVLHSFARPGGPDRSDIYRALRWKYGHWHKQAYPTHHQRMADRIAGLWPSFQSAAGTDPEAAFEFWREHLRGPGGTPFVTITFLLHVLWPERIPILDQHTFRAMHYLLGQVRSGWQSKKKPSTLEDLLMYVEFFNSLQEHWSDGPGRIEFDQGLMVLGQQLKKARASSDPDQPGEVPEEWENWLAFFTAQLPKPVDQEEEADGSVTFLGGEPGEVVVRLTRSSITVSEFAVAWEGPRRPVVSPRRIGVLFWPRVGSPTAVSIVEGLIEAARSSRRSTYQLCTLCETLTPPEWMEDDDTCLSCAEAQRGGVH